MAQPSRIVHLSRFPAKVHFAFVGFLLEGHDS